MSSASSRYPGPSPLLKMAAYALLALLALAPLLAVEIPPLVDYPNHIARMHILATDGAAEATTNYVVAWRPIPNLAMDLIVPPLGRVIGIYAAGRVFLAICLLTLAIGICTLYRVVHGTLDLWPAASLLIVYSLPFGWGFLNFYLSVGLALLLFAGWLATAKWPALRRLLVFNLAVGVLYLAHLFGVVVYGLCVAVSESQGAIAARDGRLAPLLRRATIALGQFGIAVALYASAKLIWEDPITPLHLGIWYGDALSKGSALLSGFLFYGGWPDLLVICFLLIVLLWAGASRRLSLAPQIRWHLLVFLLLTLAAPEVFRGLFLDARVGFVLACLAIAAFRPRFANRGIVAGFLASLLVVSVVKTEAVTRTWSHYDDDYNEFRGALASVPRGARILSVHDLPGALPELSDSVHWRMAFPAYNAGLAQGYAYRNLINLAVIERDAFVPYLFTYPAAQPVQAAEALRAIDAIEPARRVTTALLRAATSEPSHSELATFATAHGEHLFWIDWPRDFDVVVVFRYGGDHGENPSPALLSPLVSGSFFDIYVVGAAPSALRGPVPTGRRGQADAAPEASGTYARRQQSAGR